MLTVIGQHDKINPSTTIVTSGRTLVNRAEFRCNKKGECVTSERDAAVSEQKLELLQKYNTEADRITRESIETSLLLLMEEKEFSSVSVTEITSRAGVSRTAYYRSCDSKEDVLRNLFNSVEDPVMAKIQKYLGHDGFDACPELFETFAQEAQSLRVIHKAGMASEYLMEMNRRFTADLTQESDAQRCRKYFRMGALSDVIFMWIDGGMKQAPADMAEYFKACIIQP